VSPGLLRAASRARSLSNEFLHGDARDHGGEALLAIVQRLHPIL
jgi:hypothetical protein